MTGQMHSSSLNIQSKLLTIANSRLTSEIMHSASWVAQICQKYQFRKIFVKGAKCICPSLEIYWFTILNVFVQIKKIYLSNCKIFLFKYQMQNRKLYIFVQIIRCSCPKSKVNVCGCPPWIFNQNFSPSLTRGGSYRTFLELAKYYKWKPLSL